MAQPQQQQNKTTEEVAEWIRQQQDKGHNQ